MSTHDHSIAAKASRNLERMAAHPEMGYFMALLSSDEISSGLALNYVRFLMGSEELMAGLDRSRIVRTLHRVEFRGQELSRRALAIAVNTIIEFTLPGSAKRSHLNLNLLIQLADQADCCLNALPARLSMIFNADEEFASLFGLEPLVNAEEIIQDMAAQTALVGGSGDEFLERVRESVLGEAIAAAPYAADFAKFLDEQ